MDVLLMAWCDLANRVHEVRSGERGATAVEYGIMLALVAGVIIAIVRSVGQKTSGGFNNVNTGW